MKKVIITSVLVGVLITPSVMGPVSANSVNSSSASCQTVSMITKPQKSSVKTSSIEYQGGNWYDPFFPPKFSIGSFTDGCNKVQAGQEANVTDGKMYASVWLDGAGLGKKKAQSFSVHLPKGLVFKESEKGSVWVTKRYPYDNKDEFIVGSWSYKKGTSELVFNLNACDLGEGEGSWEIRQDFVFKVVGVNHLNDLNSSSSSSVKSSSSKKSSSVQSSSVKSSSSSSSSINSSVMSASSSSSSELPLNQFARIHGNTYLDHRVTFLGGFDISNYHYNGRPQTYEYQFMGLIGAHFVGGTSKLKTTITNVFGDKENFVAGEVKGEKNGIVYVTIYPDERLKDMGSFYLTPTGIYTLWEPDRASSSSRVINNTVASQHYASSKKPDSSRLTTSTSPSRGYASKKSVSSSQSSSVVSSSKQLNSSSVKSSSAVKSSSKSSSSSVKSSTAVSSSKSSSSSSVKSSSSSKKSSSGVKSSSFNSSSKNGVQSSSAIKGTKQGTDNNTVNDVNNTQSNTVLPETGNKPFNVFEFLIDLFK